MINPTNIPGLKQIASGSAYLDDLANQYILKPLGATGIGGFVFDYEGETSVRISSDITDHYTESNEAIQDHIALKPPTITLRGFVSELSYAPPMVQAAIQAIADRLGVAAAFLTPYSPGMQQSITKAANQAISAINSIDQAVNRAENLAGLFTAPGATRQQQAYQKLKSLWQSKQIFTCQTPFEYFPMVAIETAVFIQPDETKYQSDIVVTLKQIRTAQVSTVPFDNTVFAGVLNLQAQDNVDPGKTAGTPKATSTMYDLFH